MGQARNWTQEEKDYLAEHWGTTTVPSLCKRLNRSENGIIVMARRLHLGAFYDAGTYITMHQLVLALGYSHGADTYKNKSWIENRGFPVRKKRNNKNFVKIVYLDDFWEWAEKNQSFLDFSKFEKNALGLEPKWVDEKRQRDRKHLRENIKSPWTPQEDAYLKDLLKAHRFTYPELSKRLKRTEGAIQRRICDLKLKERPIKADNHNLWSEEQIATLGTLIKQGCNYEIIHEKIPDKSVKAIRGLVYRYYLSESLDKVRRSIGNGEFGDNLPERQLRHFRVMPPEERNEMKECVSQLAYLLNQRARELSSVCDEFKDYWQKDMCINWSDILGCKAGEDNCDSCRSFQRIREQYCSRCGATFFSRKQQIMCAPCLDARKKQAQRKWAVMNKRKRRREG